MEQDDCKLLLARVEDLAGSVRRYNRTVYTPFLDPAMLKKAESLLRNYKDIAYRVTGGYSGSERNIILMYPDWEDENNIEVPISILSVSWDDRYYKIGHRDILGSILGLGIKREKIGDIIVETNYAYVLVCKDISSYIVDNLMKIGRAPININPIEPQDMEVSTRSGKIIKTSVSSMRLDCIASSGFGMSRSKIVPIICGGMAYVNWEPVLKPDYGIKEGDIISLRGKGRIKVIEVTGMSKKNRFHIILEKW